MNWKTIIQYVFEALIVALPEPWRSLAAAVYEIIKPWLEAEHTNEIMSASESRNVTAGAPAEFREGVRKRLANLINRIPFPFIRFMAGRMVSRYVTDKLLDAVWDRAFNNSTFGVETRATVEETQYVEELLAAVRA